MRLIYLSTFWTVLLDFFLWLVIHLGVVWVMLHLSDRRFRPGGRFFRPRSWEKGGRIYEEVFKIKKWKERLPDGSGLAGKKGFPKKQLQEKSLSYLDRFLRETCRAELTHWIIILFAPFFFLWNKTGVGFVMILYALIENLPLIMAQRYNRSRLIRILSKANNKD
jgi:glycosyl-4,4'-diaponeurosporenoate acyltransferase